MSGSTLKSCSVARRERFRSIVNNSMRIPKRSNCLLEQIDRGQVVVAEGVEGIAGFAVIVIDQGSAELDGVFVEPDLWLRGVGVGARRICSA